MTPLVFDRPQSPSRPSRVVLAAGTWAAGGAAVAAEGWVGGLVLANRMFGGRLIAPDFPAERLIEFGVRLAAIGGGWGLLVGLVGGLVRLRNQSLLNRMAAGSLGAVGGAVVGLIGGGLVPVSVAVVGRALPLEVSSSPGWAFAGMLAGLVAFGWTQIREKSPLVADEEPDKAVELGPPLVGEGWPWSLLTAAKWALGGAAAAAGAWMFGVLVSQLILGVGMVPPKGKPVQVAFTAASAGAACGVVIGLVVGVARGGGRYRDRGALGAVGGGLVGLIGGGLAPLLAIELRRWLPLEVGAALGWAFAGLLAGLVAYGWTSATARQERRIRERERRFKVLTEED